MSNKIQNISDEIDSNVNEIISTFSIFSGPLVYVNLDDTIEAIDIDSQFAQFEVVFFEYFDNSLKK
ncbi:MAG: hypothetical protein IPN97_13560 [Saprospiraceae bacterium]|nr:hypothetical protein [Saprospiraceae bacterium]